MAISKFPAHCPEPAERKEIHIFGKVIRKYRVQSKFNQRDLAKRMGVNQNTICNWETDKNQPEIANARLNAPDATLTDLGQSLNPPLGKSGVNHRMRRLMTYLPKEDQP